MSGKRGSKNSVQAALTEQTGALSQSARYPTMPPEIRRMNMAVINSRNEAAASFAWPASITSDATKLIGRLDPCAGDDIELMNFGLGRFTDCEGYLSAQLADKNNAFQIAKDDLFVSVKESKAAVGGMLPSQVQIKRKDGVVEIYNRPAGATALDGTPQAPKYTTLHEKITWANDTARKHFDDVKKVASSIERLVQP